MLGAANPIVRQERRPRTLNAGGGSQQESLPTFIEGGTKRDTPKALAVSASPLFLAPQMSCGAIASSFSSLPGLPKNAENVAPKTLSLGDSVPASQTGHGRESFSRTIVVGLFAGHLRLVRGVARAVRVKVKASHLSSCRSPKKPSESLTMVC